MESLLIANFEAPYLSLTSHELSKRCGFCLDSSLFFNHDSPQSGNMIQPLDGHSISKLTPFSTRKRQPGDISKQFLEGLNYKSSSPMGI